MLPARSFRYHLLATQPIHRSKWWKNLQWPFVAMRVMAQARAVLRAENPSAVVGTGGYASGPIVYVASRLRIPIVLQEQNAQPGFTTRRLAHHARRLYLGFPEAADRLRVGRDATVLCCGNPISPPPDPLPSREVARRQLGISERQPVVFVVGGSQGARALNDALAAALSDGVLHGVTVLWGTGQVGFDAYKEFALRPDCVVRAFWDPIGDAYAAADLVVARAGAMTTAELCAWGKPAVYVPLPSAAADHQTRNAQALADAGAALLLPQAQLTGSSLARTVRELFGDEIGLAKMGSAAARRGHPKAAETIARSILDLVG